MNGTNYYPLQTIDQISSSSHNSFSPKPRTDSSIFSYSMPPPSDSSIHRSGLADSLGPLDAIVDSISNDRDDPLAQYLNAKKRFLAQSVEDILRLIYQRQSLKYESIGRMLQESARLGGHLRELGDWMMGADKGIDKTRSQIEKELATLERERRMEEVNCWRDVTRLRSELRETLMEFNHEKEKEQFLEIGADRE